jgi:DNA-binding XRE family transcriptional regulator
MKNIAQTHHQSKEYGCKIWYLFNHFRGCQALYRSDTESQRKEGQFMNLGENIKRARLASGITQKELADRLGVYAKDICRWETGERTPSVLTFGRICAALHASADELLELKP